MPKAIRYGKKYGSKSTTGVAITMTPKTNRAAESASKSAPKIRLKLTLAPISNQRKKKRRKAAITLIVEPKPMPA